MEAINTHRNHKSISRSKKRSITPAVILSIEGGNIIIGKLLANMVVANIQRIW